MHGRSTWRAGGKTRKDVFRAMPMKRTVAGGADIVLFQMSANTSGPKG